MRQIIGRILFFLAIALVLLAFVASARAQQPSQCGPYAMMAEGLAKEYSERLAFVALAPDGRRIELWVSPAGETFSLVIEHPALPGIACMIGSGSDFRVAPDMAKPGRGA
ncbi:MAG: hypothetical protein FJ271_22835 [Planctomycetes bacterium]|nr:hypothetical protein [Planctomycetota bacterium]